MSSTNTNTTTPFTAGGGVNTRLIFINLPVSDVPKATEFYTSIGGTLNPIYSMSECSCMVFSDAIQVMIMTPAMFKGFCPSERSVVDPKKSVQVLLSMSVKDREDVDKLCEIAGTKGGRKDPTTLKGVPGMYGRSFEDLDGHIWELMWVDPEYKGEGCPIANDQKCEEEAKKKGEKQEAEKK